MGWFADDVSDLHYVGPILVVAVSVVLILLGQVVTTRISADILENCDVTAIKESAKGIWTNIAVTAALMLTLVAAMLQVDPIEPTGPSVLDENPEFLVDIQQTYVASVVCSFLLNLLSMLLCVVNLSYVEPLTATDAIKFFLDRPDTLGDPITLMVVAALLMFVGLVLWVLGTYGMTLALVAIGMGLLTWICCACQWRVNGAFDPSALGPGGYAWTQRDPSEWPAKKSESGTKMSTMQGSKQIRILVKKLGRAILDEEERLKTQD